MSRKDRASKLTNPYKTTSQEPLKTCRVRSKSQMRIRLNSLRKFWANLSFSVPPSRFRSAKKQKTPTRTASQTSTSNRSLQTRTSGRTKSELTMQKTTMRGRTKVQIISFMIGTKTDRLKLFTGRYCRVNYSTRSKRCRLKLLAIKTAFKMASNT